MNVLHIAWRELRATFSSPVGWLVLCGYLFVTGVFWTFMVENFVVETQDMMYNPYGASQITLQAYLLTPFFGNCAVVLLMILPAVSMRLFAEEFRQRTIDLLFTSPVSTAEIVLGKYLGAMGFVSVLLGMSLHYPLALMQWADPDPGLLFGGYLAMFLMSAMLVAMGTLFSSLTSNQIVSLVLTFAASLTLFVLDWGADNPQAWNAQLALGPHMSDMMNGAVKLSDLAYFVLISAVCLFATHQRMESFRWT